MYVEQQDAKLPTANPLRNLPPKNISFVVAINSRVIAMNEIDLIGQHTGV